MRKKMKYAWRIFGFVFVLALVVYFGGSRFSSKAQEQRGKTNSFKRFEKPDSVTNIIRDGSN
jgi:hypothetical protein